MRPQPALLLLVAAAAYGAEAQPLALEPLTPSPARGSLVELRVQGLGRYPNPYDPAVVRLDAELEAPSGAKLTVPGFHITPCEAARAPATPRLAKTMRIFVGAAHWRKGTAVEFLVDDLALVDTKTRERVVIDDFEGGQKWLPQDSDLSIEAERVHAGKGSLRIAVDIGDSRWPGASLKLGGADWSRFGEIRAWVCPLRGLGQGVPTIEFWTEDGRKLQRPIRAVEGAEPGTWRELIWRLPSAQPPLEWKPAHPPHWRIRLRPGEAGTYRLRARVRDAAGVRFGPWTPLPVADGPAPGFLRASPTDPRYLAFGSGKPFFAVGINLLGRDLDTYRHYVGRLADHGGNFIRIWLSPRTMGIETADSGPIRYDQARAAQLDALLDLCARRGVYIMACISDFREVCSFHQNSDWPNSPYNAARGGPCTRAEGFFTAPKAREQYRAKLRYLVARYGHSPHIHSWEFFNEVNITDGWRKTPEAVRAWHREMGAALHALDPQKHLITSSFAGIEDDVLWEQPQMHVVQRHQYIDGEQSFAALVAEAHARLRRHRKPVLMGEFGRRKNRYASLDSRGVSLHNGLWAATLAGGCGTAMSWWWQWIDEHGIWPAFRSVAAFTEGIDWPREGFQPSQGAAVSAAPDPEHGFGPIAFAPTSGGFKPAPFNAPVALHVSPRGRLDQPKTLPRILHGLRNHRALHNPVTLHTAFPHATAFRLVVAGVSGHGGAALDIRIDGRTALTKQFPDTWPDDTTLMTRYDGPYEVPLPAGKHAVTIENAGNDWLFVRSYRFGAGRPDPPVRVMALRGRATTLVWVWNETHAWYRPVLHTPHVRLADVAVTLDGLQPGRHRLRPFDPWTGQWGSATTLNVPADGRARLPIGPLSSDFAFRLERLP